MKTILKKVVVLLVLSVMVTSVYTLACGQDITGLPSLDTRVVVYGGRAMVEVGGKLYEIKRENSAYVQFEGRHLRLFGPEIVDHGRGKPGEIDFKGAILIDAIV